MMFGRNCPWPLAESRRSTLTHTSTLTAFQNYGAVNSFPAATQYPSLPFGPQAVQGRLGPPQGVPPPR